MNRGEKQIRKLLLLGFGGLLLLLALTGLVALSVLRNIEHRNEAIREEYVNRSRILEQLRTDIYLSGTYVRDLLLEPDPAMADAHRKELYAAQSHVQSRLSEYQMAVRPEEQEAFERFGREVSAYFLSLQPALQWDAAARRRLGYQFMKDSLLPRRLIVVRLADQIGQLNQKQMQTGSRQVAELFTEFRKSLIVLLIFTVAVGASLASGSIYRILRLERLSALRLEEMMQARSALRDLSTRLVQLQESERRALSRELHDEVGQSLSAVLLGIGNAAAAIPDEGGANARIQLNELRRLTERTVAEVRDMSLLLRPSMLDDLGLIPALEWQAREVSRTSNISVQVKADRISECLTEDQRTCIYRVTQEALRNVVRHARAKHVQVNLSQDDHLLQLTIQDDGRGFVPVRQRGVGLIGMEERVTHLAGSFHLDSQPGRGTTITIELPSEQGA